MPAGGYLANIQTMKLHTLLTAILGIGILTTSCKSISKLSAKDGSTAKAPVKKTNTDPQFLNIEVKPGSVVTSKHKTTGTKKEAVAYTNPDPNFTATSVNIEKADMLQIKYALIMDVTVEKLTNLPLLQKIEEWWGTRYCLGGSTKTCIDCSAFTSVVLKDVYGIALQRTAQQQYDQSTHISNDALKEGDLVFFHTHGREISHVGIYVANNKFVHASTSGGVTITDLDDKYWHTRYKGAGRIVNQ